MSFYLDSKTTYVTRTSSGFASANHAWLDVSFKYVIAFILSNDVDLHHLKSIGWQKATASGQAPASTDTSGASFNGSIVSLEHLNRLHVRITKVERFGDGNDTDVILRGI